MTSEKPVLALWESNLTIATMLNVQPQFHVDLPLQGAWN